MTDPHITRFDKVQAGAFYDGNGDAISGVSDHGALTGLADDDHTQYALANGSRGAFAATSHTHAPSAITQAGAVSGDVLAWNGSAWAPATPAAGVTDHGALTGLSDDDHSIYAVTAPATSARNVIQPTGAAVIPLTLRGAASQSANSLAVQNSAGTVQGSIDPYGRILVNPSTWDSSAPLLQLTKAAADPQGGVYPAFIDCKNSGGTSLFAVNWQGIVLAAGMNASGVGFDLTIGNGGNFRVRDAASATLISATHNAGGYVTNAGTKRIEWNSTGIGFFAAAPVAKQTISGSRGGNAALADLLTKLALAGLITDSTSA